jgi:glycosyltransferase involved in cell wall biosynthesis
VEVPNNLRFSVVVPTRDRPGSLARCLDAIEHQDVDGAFDVVVVDDGSRVAEDVAAVVGSNGRARLVRTPPGGSAQARNRGVREARAPVVLLLDDDCEPRPNWAATLVAAVENGAPVAAGRGVNPEPADALADATQTILDYLTLSSLRRDRTASFVPTYNLACRRELALSLPFDESYVNEGADRDWCARLVQSGSSIAFEPMAVVDHRQRLGLGSFWRKHSAYGGGSARFHRRHGSGLERPVFYARLLVAGFRRGPRTGLAVCLAQLATAVGFIRPRAAA